MIIKAKYSTICPVCNRYINVGDNIEYTKGEKGKHYHCVTEFNYDKVKQFLTDNEYCFISFNSTDNKDEVIIRREQNEIEINCFPSFKKGILINEIDKYLDVLKKDMYIPDEFKRREIR